MARTSFLGDILGTLFERRRRANAGEDTRPIHELCAALMDAKAEISTLQIASQTLECYAKLDDEGKAGFFRHLNEELDIDADRVRELAEEYSEARDEATFSALSRAAEPGRQELLRRLNQAPGATADLVAMRVDLLALAKTETALSRTDYDFAHLLRSWFNRGFLVLRQIDWDSSATVLEKIIAYEAVHEIRSWNDLRLRLRPSDRRCFAFFHPAMPDEPLIFVEVALTRGVPDSIQDLLSKDRDAIDAEVADTAVFYSISNCQAGLAGISFGNSLIKQVVRELSADLPALKTFVTLSPIPGLSGWLEAEGLSETLAGDDLKRLASHYLLEAKRDDGAPLDPVARFHLGNGAAVMAVHDEADTSKNGLKRSRGVMVNYHYDIKNIAENHQRFANNQEVTASAEVRALAKQAGSAR